jgi:hypothetical protein
MELVSYNIQLSWKGLGRKISRPTCISMYLLVISSDGVKENHETVQPLDQTGQAGLNPEHKWGKLQSELSCPYT